MNRGMLNVNDYRILQRADWFAKGEVARVLEDNGAPNWTICPTCQVPGFAHAPGCQLMAIKTA